MSTERELTPGTTQQLHPLSYSDMATHIQLNGVIMGKSFNGKLPSFLPIPSGRGLLNTFPSSCLS